MVDDSAVAIDLSRFSAEVGDHCVAVTALKVAVDAQCVETLWTEGGMGRGEGIGEREREGGGGKVQVDLGYFFVSVHDA